MAPSELLLTFYGDDMTGSTDAMEGLTLNGVPTALFLAPPTGKQLQRFPGLRAVGVAGVSRTMSPAQMDAELLPAFAALRKLNAPICHYKVCSTFDSSPTVGSIGRATAIGQAAFAARMTPMLIGAPALKRYVAFGNLFATVGEETYRLDRHPTMSRHPVTPMHEADLRRHLAEQTEKHIGLIDVLHLAAGAEALEVRLQQLHAAGAEIVLFDTMSDDDLLRIGRLLWQQAGGIPLFIVGSSGVEYALTAWWRQIGVIGPRPAISAPGAVDRLIVLSGSAAPVTAAQIDWATAQGYADQRLDTLRLIDPEQRPAEFEASLQRALTTLDRGQSVILYAAHGPDDPAITATREAAERLGMDAATTGARLASVQGHLLARLLHETKLRRACVTGGDSSGHVARELGLEALEVMIPIAPGAPLCRATAIEPAVDGLQIALKGGQNGQVDYFEAVRKGRSG